MSQRSKLFFLNARDFAKGFAVAFISALVTFLTEHLQANETFNWQQIGIVAGISFLSYMIKNLLTNSRDQLFKKDIT